MIEEYSLALPIAPTAAEDRLDAGLEAELDLAPLVASYSALLFRVAHSILRNRAEAEDVVQDTFVRVLEHRRKLPAVRDMRVWLVRIAWNLALDRCRRVRPEQIDDFFAHSLLGNNVPADKAIANVQEVQTVLREIDRLPKDERQVLLLSALDELETAAIAEIAGRSESAVRALLFRARTKLKARIAKGGFAS